MRYYINWQITSSFYKNEIRILIKNTSANQSWHATLINSGIHWRVNIYSGPPDSRFNVLITAMNLLDVLLLFIFYFYIYLVFSSVFYSLVVTVITPILSLTPCLVKVQAEKCLIYYGRFGFLLIMSFRKMIDLPLL